MKKVLYIVIMLLAAFSCMSLPVQSQRLNVMSFNIRYQNKHDGNNAWENRKDAMVRFLDKRHPDVFGLQEVLDEQFTVLCSHLSDYEAVGIGRDDGARKGEYAPVFFLKSRYILIDSGTFWLSDTPDEVSRGWDAVCNRICTWALLQHRKSGKRFIFASTHLDHRGVTARTNAARLIKQRLGSTSAGLPIVLVGDFNVTEKSEAYETISGYDYALNDTWKVSKRCNGLTCSFNGWGEYNDENGEKIDFVFVSPSIKVKKAAIFDSHIKEDRYLSDHNSLWVEIVVY